ncbi:MAG: hypothetical protein WDZ93_01510 [Candidatus Paceibacterota bacterium]
MWERNASKFMTGGDSRWRTVAVVSILMVGIPLLLVEYWAHTVSGFAARYSHPSAVFWILVNDFHLIWPRFTATAWRGMVGILAAGLIAYPLGVLFICIGPLTRFFFLVTLALLVMPKLNVALVAQWTYGYGETSMYIISFWIGCVFMFASGFLGALLLHTFQRVEKDADSIFQASALDGTRFWAHYRMAMQMLRAHHVSSLQILAMAIWTSLTFSEAISSVIGLGERMHDKVRLESTIGYAWAMSFLIILLEVASFIAIAYIGYLANVRVPIIPARTNDRTPPSAE